METSRRRLVASVPVVALAGCAEFRSSEASVRLHNYRNEPHYIHVRLRGTENDEWVYQATDYLEPDSGRIQPETLDRDAVEGDVLVVSTRIDHRPEQEHEVNPAFDSMGVSIQEDFSINITKGHQ